MASQLFIFMQSLALCAASWVCWKMIRRFLKSPLDNIPGPIAKSWWSGTFPQVFNVNAWDFHKEMAEMYGSVIKIKSFFGENQLYVFDPFICPFQDQSIFQQSAGSLAGAKVIFGPSILATVVCDPHRKQRKMLNPAFSIKHLREMTPTFYNVVHKVSYLSFYHRSAISYWLSKSFEMPLLTALELIGQSGLGYSFDSLQEDSVPHPYTISTKKLMYIGIPRFIVNLIPSQPIRELREIVDILHNTSVEILQSKKKALEEGDEAVSRQIGQGKDILSILMRANMEASNEDVLSQEELLAQMSSLTFAAMDTTSSALSRILYLLSTNQEAQERLRQEIRTAKKEYGPDLDYDTLSSLPYLDAICRETLRLHAPVPFITKTRCTPLSKPIMGMDGKEIHEVFVPSNTNVVVGIMAANRNTDIWGPDAYEWKPSRWLEPLPETVATAHLPGVYSHLGFKFSQLEMKVVLSDLIDSFKFSPTDKEIFWQMSSIAHLRWRI
ncbi:cytochrome P450 [Pholiota molesta]|nr:cytochrome P450 [Pholiota molesta]